MSDLRELYQELILDHHKRPRNFGKLTDATRTVEGYNPLCGDRLTLGVKVEDGIVTDIRFEGKGCAISTASASLMCESIKGKTLAEAETLFQNFHELIVGENPADIDQKKLGKLAVLGGVREFPTRVKCATLCWHTLHNAIEGKEEPVTTE